MTSTHASRFIERVAQKFQPGKRAVGYLSMEYGLRNDMKIFGGGLGVLAGDTIKSAADKGLPLAAVGLLYRDGYFRQQILDGRQVSIPEDWDPEKHPEIIDTEQVVTVKMEGKPVNFKVWGTEVPGLSGDFVPLLLLDSHGVQNPMGFEGITTSLYSAEPWNRITQEKALGIGGLRAFEALGISPSLYHLNEGHAAFAVVEALSRLGKDFENLTPAEKESVRQRFAFTTHTPVAAGFDRFHRDLIYKIFTSEFDRRAIFTMGMDPRNADFINMAYLAMRGSFSINAVAQLHAAVSRKIFEPISGEVDVSGIIGITNGVHHLTWTSPHLAAVYDKHCPDWRKDPKQLINLRYKIDDIEFRRDLAEAHGKAKKDLFNTAGRKDFKTDILTIGFARRFAGYKRGDLLFTDLEELKRIATEFGPMQIVFAGKAHPSDGAGQGIMSNVIARGKQIEEETHGLIKFVFIENYDMDKGALMTAGVDIWLNNPIPPLEASGTSGMKAALNGVPQASTYDGWWPEGSFGDTTGWTFGSAQTAGAGEQGAYYREDSSSLYRTLGQVSELYYSEAKQDLRFSAFMNKMIFALSRNGAFFNTDRMVEEYRNIWGV